MKSPERSAVSLLFSMLLVSQGYCAESTSATAQVVISLRIPDMISISGLDPIEMAWQPGQRRF